MDKDYDKIHHNNIDIYAKKMQDVYDSALKEAANISSLIRDFSGNKPFSFANYPITKDRVDKLFKSLINNVEVVVLNGIDHEWTLSNNKNSELSRRVFGDNVGKMSKEQEQRYFNNNHNARDAFKKRKTGGLRLSDRVWKYTDQFKEEIELGIDCGLRDRLSAVDMAKDLKQYLRYPDKLFRRVRNEHGQLVLSKAAKLFNPGQGVYRSSVRNAQRLARTEINMAYRSADHERWQQLDFVVGVEVRRSNNNYNCPMCDSLKGKYPKDFKFTSWHPQCRCYAISILKSPDESESNKPSVNEVNTTPKGFDTWVKDNKTRFNDNNMPYFMRDNKVFMDKALGVESPKVQIPTVKTSNITRSKKLEDAKRKQAITDAAEKRHANRDAEAIQDKWIATRIVPPNTPIKELTDVQGVIDRYLKYFPDDTNGKKIHLEAFRNKASKNGYIMMHAYSQKGIVGFNAQPAKTYGYKKGDAPFDRVIRSFDKIRKQEALNFNEEYSIESFYHEILHVKAKKYKALKGHGSGEFKRTAMETVNQFVSRHDYASFIERMGGQAINQDSILEKGRGYGDWVKRFREMTSSIQLNENDVVKHFRNVLLNNPYDVIDDAIFDFMKKNTGDKLQTYSRDGFMECLERGGAKWDFLISLINNSNR